jgi:hypothetical protein
MTRISGPSRPSPRRAELASFPHAYVVAIRLRHQTGADQYIVRTGDPTRPFRVASTPPTGVETLAVMVA